MTILKLKTYITLIILSFVTFSAILALAPTANNDGPYLVNERATLNVSAFLGVLANDTDFDGPSPLTSVKVVDTQPQYGTLTLNSNGSFTYVHNGSETGSDFFTYRAYDGSEYSTAATVNITITAVNDAPVLGGMEPGLLQYTEGNAATVITSSITISDVDDTHIESATINISGNFNDDEDVLSYSPAVTGISGSFNSTTGIFSLSGSAIISSYETALKRIRYQNINDTTPSTLNRTVSFVIFDGDSYSYTVSRTIQINQQNDPPYVSGVVTQGINYIVGELLQGDYDFADPEDDDEGTSTFQWYRANNVSGTGATPISGAILKNYTTTINDSGKFVAFQVTPVDEHSLAGTTVRSDFQYINAPPIALNLHTDVPVAAGETVRARFNYSDKENDPQGNHIFRWYRCTEAIPGNCTFTGTPIDYDSIVTISPSWKGDYVGFIVTPIATSGSLSGITKQSTWWPVNDYPTATISTTLNGIDSLCRGSGTRNIQIECTGDNPPWTIDLMRNGILVVNNITINTSPYQRAVSDSGFYYLQDLTDNKYKDPAKNLTYDSAHISYYKIPTATIPGGQNKSLCEGDTTTNYINVTLTGMAPWSLQYEIDDQIPSIQVNNISTSPYKIPVKGTGISGLLDTYTLVSVTDYHACTGGVVSGQATISKKTSPVAVISGDKYICSEDETTLPVTLTAGNIPWRITYTVNGENPVTTTNIYVPVNTSYNLPVSDSGTYKITNVYDGQDGCGIGKGEVYYYEAPTVTISGNTTICQHTAGTVNLALTGTAPWSVTYLLNDTMPTTVTKEVQNSTLTVQHHGIYTIDTVRDFHSCLGTHSGSANVTVTPAPSVAFRIGDIDKNIYTFSLEVEPGQQPADKKEPMFFSPSNGNFDLSDDFYSVSNYFYTVFTDMLFPDASPYRIIYRYNDGSCWGYDTAFVNLINSESEIIFTNNNNQYCTNSESFDIYGANIEDTIGWFEFSGPANALIDNEDNSATVHPSLLNTGEYFITYKYYKDGVEDPLPVDTNLMINSKPNANFYWHNECFDNLIGNADVKFINTSTSSSGITGYFWKFFNDTGYDSSLVQNPEYTYTNLDNYNVKLIIEDNIGCTDSILKVLPLRNTYDINISDYFEDFEDGMSTWISQTEDESGKNSWTYGITSGTRFSAENSSMAWYTNLGTNKSAEQSYVTSPCFNLSNTTRPMIKIDMFKVFDEDRDGAVLQYTADSGRTWERIGNVGTGISWYNSDDIGGEPGGSEKGWTSLNNIADTEWKNAKHGIDMLKEFSNIQFRIAYGSDGTGDDNEGLAFDNIWIGERSKTVLLEHFTNAGQEESKDANEIFNNVVNSNPNDVVDIQYHINYPGSDPFYNSYSTVRALNNYGITDVPFSILDGGHDSDGEILQHQYDYNEDDIPASNDISIQSLHDPKFDIGLEAKLYGNTIDVKSKFTALEEIPYSSITFHLAVIEKEIIGVTGDNGETVFESVLKSMLPNAAGNNFQRSWNEGYFMNISESQSLSNIFNINEVSVVAFIQNENTKEIYQAKIVNAEISSGIEENITQKFKTKIFPNPSCQDIYIIFNQPASDDYNIDLYNSIGIKVDSKILEQGTERYNLDVSYLKEGMYFLIIKDNNRIIDTQKLLIVK